MSLEQLAVRARTALSNARAVTLAVHGLAVGDVADGVVLHEREGRPTFLCLPHSPVRDAAGNYAEVSIEAGNASGERWTVTLTGRLERHGTEHVDGVEVAVIELAPQRVELVSAGRRTYDVPLELYHRAGADAFACCAARIVEHTNRAHPDELRGTAAAVAGVRVAAVAAAELADLDRDGALLHWVDVDGAHRHRLQFATPAGGPHDLARTLRAALSPDPVRPEEG